MHHYKYLSSLQNFEVTGYSPLHYEAPVRILLPLYQTILPIVRCLNHDLYSRRTIALNGIGEINAPAPSKGGFIFIYIY
jgi:hypothetical protein